MTQQTESVGDILRRHVATERKYASYWKFSIDRRVEECNIAAHLLAYLEAFEGWVDPQIKSSEIDPPDCYGFAADGETFGIEVTELVHRRTVERHQLRQNAARNDRLRKRDTADCWEVANWTAESLKDALSVLVKGKDRKASGGPFMPYLVAIFTDETMVTKELVQKALAGINIKTDYIDAAYLLLSYDPADEGFPNKTPVFRLPVVGPSKSVR